MFCKLSGYPSALRPADRLLAVDGVALVPIPGSVDAGVLVEMAEYEPGQGVVVTVWGSQMFELHLSPSTPIQFAREIAGEAPTPEQAMARARARRRATEVAEGECPSCAMPAAHRADRGYVPGSTGMPVSCSDEWHDDDDPIDLADAAAGNLTPGSEY